MSGSWFSATTICFFWASAAAGASASATATTATDASFTILLMSFLPVVQTTDRAA